MRIGIYDPYLDDLGGGEKYMMAIAECLSRNHDVTVFWDSRADINKLIERFSLNLEKVKIKNNIFSPKINILKRLFITKQYDVFIVLIDGSIPIISSQKLFLHIQQPLSNINKLTLKNKLKIDRVTSMFYNSSYTKDFNEKIFQGVSSKVIYPPVKIYSKKLLKENFIIHVGRYRIINGNNDDFKKQQVMINTFKNMVDNGLKDWKFIIAISINIDNDPNLKKMIDSALDYPIEFLINNNNEQLWELYNKAKIYWHASGFGEDLIEHPEYAEHFGISTVEAMGAGVVPVVINAGGQKEIVANGENGFLWDTLDEFKKTTRKLIDDKKLWQELSDKARIQAKNFSYERFCKDINVLINS